MAEKSKKPGISVKEKIKGKGRRGRMPVKRSINLALADEKKIPLIKAIPAIILIVILAVLFSKFLVADRLIEMSRAADYAAQLRKDVDMAMKEIKSYGDIEETYAHYTFSGMTEEEMSLVDRTEVVELINTVLTTGDTQKTWTVSGNILTIEITGNSLDEINRLTSKIEESPIVDSCTITTANKELKESDSKRSSSTSTSGSSTLSGTSGLFREKTDSDDRTYVEVRAKYIVYLQKPKEEES